MKKLLLGFVTLILIACTIKISTTINFSDFTSAENKKLIADFRVSVMSCSEEDIQDIKREFEKRNIVASYNKCSSDDGFNDYASFSLPIALIKETEYSNTFKSDIYFKYINNTLYLQTSARFASMLDSSSEFVSEKLQISSIDFYLVNDDVKTIKIHPILVFINEKPVFDKTVEVKPFSKVLITLPDAANKLLESSNAVYELFKVVD